MVFVHAPAAEGRGARVNPDMRREPAGQAKRAQGAARENALPERRMQCLLLKRNLID
jgi:hypothetical protein